MPFFDYENAFQVKTDLWYIANVAHGLMDLFYGISEKFKGLKFSHDFLPRIRKLKIDNNSLKQEMTSHPTYKKHKIDITPPNTG